MREAVARGAKLASLVAGYNPLDLADVHERAWAATRAPLPPSCSKGAADLLIGVCDLTSLEASDTPGRIVQLAATATAPDPSGTASPVAALCVHTDLVPFAREAMDAAGSPVAVAAACGAFPHGRASLRVKLADVADAVAGGADELDVVMDRAALLSGNYTQVVDELVAIGEVAGDRPVKVIIESGELPDLATVRIAALLALASGAEFVKTSTGKTPKGASIEAALVIGDAVREFEDMFGQRRGMKVSGGVRTVTDAANYLAVFATTVGEDQATPDRFRLGASALLGALVSYRSATSGASSA